MYDLIKFSDSKYVDSILDGKLYMNSLGYFWRNGVEVQKDFAEGTEFFTKADDILPKDIAQYTLGNVGMLNDNYKYVNVFCMYRLDRYLDQVLNIDKRTLEFGDYAIHITNADAFISRVQRALINYSDAKYCCGDVDYYDYMSSQITRYNFGCFCKTRDYEYQKEWRISLMLNYSQLKKSAQGQVNVPFDKPFILNIGSIRKIATVIPSETIINHPEQYFSSKKVVDEIKREYVLTPKLADEWFDKGILCPRNALDGAYWGNTEKDAFNRYVYELAVGTYKPYFTIG